MKIKKVASILMLAAVLITSSFPMSLGKIYADSGNGQDISSAVYTQVKPIDVEWLDIDKTVMYCDPDCDEFPNMVGDKITVTYTNGKTEEFVCEQRRSGEYYTSVEPDEYGNYNEIVPEFRDGQTKDTKWEPGTSHEVPVYINGIKASGTLKVNVSDYKRIDWPEVSMKKSTLVYNGKTQHPKVVVKALGKTLPSTQYTIKWPKKSKKIGFYTIKVTLKDQYRGQETAYYHIGPKGTSIKKVTPVKRSFKVNWKKATGKAAKNVDGYAICFSTRKDAFKYMESFVYFKYIKGKNKTSANISKAMGEKLRKNTVYYVKIATYKNVKGSEVMSPLSKKTFKVKVR